MVTTKDFNDMTTPQLYDLNRLLVAEIRSRNKDESRTKASRFRHGQAVKFADNKGRMYTGTIIKFNSKTISVRTEGGTYRVPPSYLMEMEPSGHDVVAELDAKEVQEFEDRHEDKPPVSDKPKTQSESTW